MSSSTEILTGVVGFPLQGPAIVVCFTGSLWVTGPSTGDVVLRPGERAEICGKGRVVVEALEPSVIAIEVGAASATRRELPWRWLTRLWRGAEAA